MAINNLGSFFGGFYGNTPTNRVFNPGYSFPIQNYNYIGGLGGFYANAGPGFGYAQNNVWGGSGLGNYFGYNNSPLGFGLGAGVTNVFGNQYNSPSNNYLWGAMANGWAFPS